MADLFWQFWCEKLLFLSILTFLLRSRGYDFHTEKPQWCFLVSTGYIELIQSTMTYFTPLCQWIWKNKHHILFISKRYLVDSHSFSKHFDNNFIQGISWGISFYSIFTQESNKSNENVFPIKWLRQKTLTMTKIHFFMRTYNCEYFSNNLVAFYPYIHHSCSKLISVPPNRLLKENAARWYVIWYTLDEISIKMFWDRVRIDQILR